ncbi:MAG: hypothetical protein Q8Q92_02185 [bacterium]|nr:hypothetical protein [bacterium]
MRIPYSVLGALFGPLFIGLSLVLKILCPASVDASCFADQLAIPIFLPLIFVYKTFGTGLIMTHELWFVLLYWSFVGFLVGLISDLREYNKSK